MRFVLALFKHETNTFSTQPTVVQSFSRGSMYEGPCYGADAIKACTGTNNAVAAYLDLARELNAEVDFVICANAVPSGVVTREAFDAIAGPIVESAAKGCDAIMLDLHGAMVADGYLDAEGELLRRLRAVQPHTPIAVALDFHANLSADFIQHADIVTGYCTYPHIDVYQTGERAARTLRAMLEKRVEPTLVWRRLPMLTQILNQSPSRQPMKDIMDLALDAERSGRVLNASVFAGFPLADTPYTGLSIVLVADKENEADAIELLDELAEMAWQRRADFITDYEPFEQTLAKAAGLTDGPVVLADHGDNCASGGTTDEMSVLREMMALGMRDAVAGPYWDPASVEALISAGMGAQCTIDLGGKTDMPAVNLRGKPLRLTGTVVNITDGSYTVTGPMFTGMRISLGRTVVLATGGVLILVSEKPQEPFDTGIFTHAGIQPETKKYILIKSKQHFLAGFGKLAKHIVMVAGPGVCGSDFSQFNYTKLERPIFPLDEAGWGQTPNGV